MGKKIYITTAIDYTNAAPHIGHAYEKVLADVIARYQRLNGKEVFFLTGVDQHGQKIQKSADQEGEAPEIYVEKKTKLFQQLWQKLNIEYDGWAATTSETHKKVVREILRKFYEQGKIYKKKTKGFYSVRQEQFLSSKDISKIPELQISSQVENFFHPEWGEIIELEEENYYFKLSEYLPWLSEFLENNPNAIFPDYRRRDVLQNLKAFGGEDLCITRPKKRLAWGIETPFDENYVTYVWFDALINYISFAGYLKDKSDKSLPNFEDLWPAEVQLIGKDILRPAHGIYWLIMLKAMGFSDDEIPRLLVHGFWNMLSLDGKSEKMSKTLGNIVEPLQLIDVYGSDSVRYYLMRDIVTGKDSDFDLLRFDALYKSELANGFGNLVSRAVNMGLKYYDKNWQKYDYLNDFGGENFKDFQSLKQHLNDLKTFYCERMEEFFIHACLEKIFEFVTKCNQLVENNKPWELAKSESPDLQKKLAGIIFHLCEAIIHITILLSPIMPELIGKITNLLGIKLGGLKLKNLSWGLLAKDFRAGNFHKPEPLFPRIENQS